MRSLGKQPYLLLAASLCLAAPIEKPQAQAQALAAEIAEAAGPQTSLCVLMGCGGGDLAVALAADGRRLVHGLEGDAAVVDACVQCAFAAGLQGRVTFQKAAWDKLPYANGMVDVLVLGPRAGILGQPAALAEATRVLARHGRVVVLDAEARAPSADDVPSLRRALGPAWTQAASSPRTVTLARTLPPACDGWKQWGHDAGESFVSQDADFAPPNSLQWLAGPSRAGAGTLILSANGRNFYVFDADDALPPGTLDPSGTEYANRDPVLLARDAANGLPLWRRRFQGNARTLIAHDAGLLTTLDDALVALSPESGEVTRTWGKFPDVRQVTLVSAPPAQTVLVLSQKGKRPAAIQAVEILSGKRLWTTAADLDARILSDGGSVFVCSGSVTQSVRRLEPATGVESWRTEVTGAVLCAKDGILLVAARGKGPQTLLAVSQTDGKVLWRYSVAATRARWNVQFAAGLVWVQRWAAEAGARDQWAGLDPGTGAVRKSYETPVYIPYGCYPSIATERYFLLNRPNDLLEWENGSIHEFRAARHGCRASSIIAGGFLVGVPNSCACYPGLIRGFAAFGHDDPGQDDADRLQTGPAFNAVPDAEASAAPDEWPMFRHDFRRSGINYVKYPEKLVPRWNADAGSPPHPLTLLGDEVRANPMGADPLTAPVVAGGRVFVGMPERQGVIALDAATGRELWRIPCEGRLDAPPAVHGDLCLFGTRHGYVYCVRASDGVLAWRFRAAPRERLIVSCGQLESRWPVVGGVMLQGGAAYAVCGRSTEIDGGLSVYALDLRTGKTLWRHAPAREPRDMTFVGLPDLLVGDGPSVSIGGSARARFDVRTGQAMFRDGFHALRAPFRTDDDPYLTPFSAEGDALGNLLGRDRHYGRFGATQHFEGENARLLVFNESWVFSYFVESARKPEEVRTGLRCLRRGRIAEQDWSFDLPRHVTVQALAGARNELFVATQREKDTRLSRPELWCLSVKEGDILWKQALPEAVLPEGLALADQRLYVATGGGKVLCFGATGP